MDTTTRVNSSFLSVPITSLTEGPSHHISNSESLQPPLCSTQRLHYNLVYCECNNGLGLILEGDHQHHLLPARKHIQQHRNLTNSPFKGCSNMENTAEGGDKAINPLLSPSVQAAHIINLSAEIIYSDWLSSLWKYYKHWIVVAYNYNRTKWVDSQKCSWRYHLHGLCLEKETKNKLWHYVFSKRDFKSSHSSIISDSLVKITAFNLPWNKINILWMFLYSYCLLMYLYLSGFKENMFELSHHLNDTWKLVPGIPHRSGRWGRTIFDGQSSNMSCVTDRIGKTLVNSLIVLMVGTVQRLSVQYTTSVVWCFVWPMTDGHF